MAPLAVDQKQNLVGRQPAQGSRVREVRRAVDPELRRAEGRRRELELLTKVGLAGYRKLGRTDHIHRHGATEIRPRLAPRSDDDDGVELGRRLRRHRSLRGRGVLLGLGGDRRLHPQQGNQCRAPKQRPPVTVRHSCFPLVLPVSSRAAFGPARYRARDRECPVSGPEPSTLPGTGRAQSFTMSTDSISRCNAAIRSVAAIARLSGAPWPAQCAPKPPSPAALAAAFRAFPAS